MSETGRKFKVYKIKKPLKIKRLTTVIVPKDGQISNFLKEDILLVLSNYL